MELNEIRLRYLRFFGERGHVVLPSSSLIPENDPTTLFTGSGMQPLVPYLLGKSHPEGTRLTDSQKCFRSMDIDEVGDNRHTTFFEMLGNWSLGDYFKHEQLHWFFEFLTAEVRLNPKRLYVTVFIGDVKNDIPRDTESAAVWKALFHGKGIDAKEGVIGSEEEGYKRGIKTGERIFYYNAKKNWWSRSGTPDKMPAGEPGGPDSEVFYEFIDIPHDKKFGAECHPNCDCGRFLEIGNSVFMQYLKQPDGSFSPLPKQNVDFGGGLERIAMVSQENNDIFAVSHKETLSQLERLTGKTYALHVGETRAFRIVADHLKAAAFLIADGAKPGNVERGYVVRRLIRRAVRYADLLGVPEDAFANLSESIVSEYQHAYPALREQAEDIRRELSKEEGRFRKTLAHGIHEFEKLASGGSISGMQAFLLFSTYGFPLELTLEMARERGITVDADGFGAEMAKHRAESRAGSEQKFRGGLADTAKETVRLHTAHHLLLRALQIVLGPDVKQRGSNITQERLRIDFSYPVKVTAEQIAEAERIVNEKIREDLPVVRLEMSREEAEHLGAEHEFGQKYPERVSVYSIGPKDATSENPRLDKRFSIEFCGGPHVSHTGELADGGKRFKIKKEEAVSAGVRRIKATLE